MFISMFLAAAANSSDLSDEIREAHNWADKAFAQPLPGSAGLLPFSFRYDGKRSNDLVAGWQYQVHRSESSSSVRTISYKDPASGLLLDCEVTTYPDSAAIDWVVHLINTSEEDTAIIEDFLPLDAVLIQGDQEGPRVLRWSQGDNCHPEAFLPQDEELKPEVVRRFAPVGGRPSNTTAFPFFNLQGPGGGWVLAVGWTGQWAAEFLQDASGEVKVQAGMEKTRFYLKPGEKVRSPRIVLLRWHGEDMTHGHNQFRRLMLGHYVQHRDGKPAAPPIAHNTAATVYRSGKEATEANQLAIIEKAADLGAEAYWMDAYWYPRPWHTNVGNWFHRPDDFPDGLRPLADAAHRKGMKFVLWFEPERVYEGTQFDQGRSEYLVKLPDSPNRLFNLGNQQARVFLTDFLDKRIKEWGVDLYRQDFNFDPLPYWQAMDSEDRQGISEMMYVEGLYLFWSDLLARNPGLTIDNCASGGRRVDIETCSLSYPLWRSDYNDIGEGLKGEGNWPYMAAADQVMVAGLSLYIPFHAGPLWDMHPYCFRSAMSPGIVLYERILHEAFPTELASAGIAELNELRPLFLGDVYPLLRLTSDQTSWYAYQLDRPDLGEGCAFFFRRPESDILMCDIELKNIDPAARYSVSITGETYERGPWEEMSGQQLMRPEIVIREKPGSVLLRYRRQ